MYQGCFLRWEQRILELWILGGKWLIFKYICNSFSFKGTWQECGLIHSLNCNVRFVRCSSKWRHPDFLFVFFLVLFKIETGFFATAGSAKIACLAWHGRLPVSLSLYSATVGETVFKTQGWCWISFHFESS